MRIREISAEMTIGNGNTIYTNARNRRIYGGVAYSCGTRGSRDNIIRKKTPYDIMYTRCSAAGTGIMSPDIRGTRRLLARVYSCTVSHEELLIAILSRVREFDFLSRKR